MAQLLPELAMRVGMLDRSTSVEGCRAVTQGGRALEAGLGLSAQGVRDGDVITIAACPVEEELDDDLAEAVARAVVTWPTWGSDPGRRTSLGAATVLLTAGAPALLTQHRGGLAAAFCVAVAVVLLAGSALLSRRWVETAPCVAVAYVACLYAAVAGSCVGWHGTVTRATAVHAGTGLTVCGATAALTLARGRLMVLPAVAVGAVLLTTGVAASLAGVDPAALQAGLLTVVVLSSASIPGTALGMTRTGRHVLLDVEAVDRAPVDVARVATDVAAARRLVVVLSSTTAVLLVLLAPAAASLGPAGAAVPVLACIVVMLRTRRCRVGTDILIGVTSGVLGVVSTAVTMVWRYDAWRLEAAAVLACAGVVVLAATLWPRRDRVGWGRCGDLVEGAALGALVPALLVALGLSLERA